MSENSIITIILALIAVGGTLVGTWLGRLLERSNDERKWRRERCVEVIIEVFNSCHIVAFEADKDYYSIECGSLEHVKQNEVVIEKVSEMDRTLHKAILLLSWDVYNKVFDLVNHCGKEIATKSQMCPKLSKSEWSKIRIIDYATLYMDCIMAARNDLELFPKRYKVMGYKESAKKYSKHEEELSKGTINPEQATLHLQEIKMKLKKSKKDI